MPANLESSAVAPGLAKVTFYSYPKEGQCQRMFRLLYNCAHFTAYLPYMQSTSYEVMDWMKHKLESRLQGEILTTSGMQMTPSLWQEQKRN